MVLIQLLVCYAIEFLLRICVRVPSPNTYRTKSKQRECFRAYAMYECQWGIRIANSKRLNVRWHERVCVRVFRVRLQFIIAYAASFFSMERALCTHSGVLLPRQTSSEPFCACTFAMCQYVPTSCTDSRSVHTHSIHDNEMRRQEKDIQYDAWQRQQISLFCERLLEHTQSTYPSILAVSREPGVRVLLLIFRVAFSFSLAASQPI